MMNTFLLVQESIDALASLSTAYNTFNFFIATVVSYTSFPVYMIEIRSMVDLLAKVKAYSNLQKDTKRNIFYFRICYAVVTGFGSAALISAQFEGPNLCTAITYGLLGPYFIRPRLSTHLKKELTDTESEVTQTMGIELDRTKDKTEKDYEMALDKILEDLLREKEYPIVKSINYAQNGDKSDHTDENQRG